MIRQSHGFADYASYPLTMLRCPQKLSCRRGWGSMEHAGFAPVNKSSNSEPGVRLRRYMERGT